MVEPVTVLCGPTTVRRPRGRVIKLCNQGPDANVEFHSEDIGRKMLAAVSPVIADLLDIAAYVHCADQSVSRGGPVSKNLAEEWYREFHFVVPVRMPDRWRSPDVNRGLERLLSFLSGDSFHFQFEQLTDRRARSEYLDYRTDSDEVALFSGGLDSLTGAIDHLSTRSGRLLLVSHQSSTKIARRQRGLVDELKLRFPNRVVHVPVRITKKGLATSETTQRTRSFLFGAIAAAVAEISGVPRISLFENGIVSLNLPIAAQVVGTSATRTTHPRVLHLMTEFLSALVERSVTITNPYLWKTKAEVAATLAASDHADLAPDTISCSHIHEMSVLHTHCGCCSQCLDRRFGALGGGLAENDPAEMYAVDLLTGGRDRPIDQTMAASFVRHALEFRGMSEAGLITQYAGELSRVTAFVPGMRPEQVVREVLGLHHRQADIVASVLEDGYRHHAELLARQGLSETCLLRLVAGPDHRHSELDELRRAEAPPPPSADGRDFERSSEIRIALDAQMRRVLVDGCQPVEGDATFKLVSKLAELAQSDIGQGRAPEHRTFFRSSALAESLGVTETSLRRSVLRVRSRLAGYFDQLFGIPLTANALIESAPWKGYRLNADVLILASSEITSAKRHGST